MGGGGGIEGTSELRYGVEVVEHLIVCKDKVRFEEGGDDVDDDDDDRSTLTQLAMLALASLVAVRRELWRRGY